MTTRPLGRDIAVALLLKLALLTLLYLLFFRADTRPAIDADRARQHLFAPVAAPPPSEVSR